MRINTNISAMNTYSSLTAANSAKSSSLEKLSSGLRINQAGDDAAGLAISEKMKNQISGMTQATRNAQDGISLIQTAEGALSETHSILNRMRDLTVQAANDTNTNDDRMAIQSEIDSLTKEIDRIAEDTEFNTQNLLDGGNSFSFQIGSNAGQTIDVSIDDMSVSGLIDGADVDGDNVTGGIKVAYTEQDIKSAQEYLSDEARGDDQITNPTEEQALKALENEDITIPLYEKGEGDTWQVVADTNVEKVNFGSQIDNLDKAIEKVSSERANLGAVQNRLDHTVSNLATTKENLSAANSRIVDVDMAEEMMDFTKNNILSQAATSMLAQANQMPQGVLSLLG